MKQQRWQKVTLVVAVVLVALLWHQGTFDYALLNVGLNAKPCGRNGFGATLCGEDLERYNREAAEPAQHARRDFEQPVSDPEDDLGFRR